MSPRYEVSVIKPVPRRAAHRRCQQRWWQWWRFKMKTNDWQFMIIKTHRRHLCQMSKSVTLTQTFRNSLKIIPGTWKLWSIEVTLFLLTVYNSFKIKNIWMERKEDHLLKNIKLDLVCSCVNTLIPFEGSQFWDSKTHLYEYRPDGCNLVCLCVCVFVCLFGL